MKKYSWILVAAAMAPLVSLACGEGTTNPLTSGAGGSGGESGVTTGSTATATATATTTGATTGTTSGTTSGTTGTGGGEPVDCSGILAASDCATCLEGGCCAELAGCDDIAGCLDCVTGTAAACDVDNKDAVDTLNACVTASCDMECGGTPPMPPDATCSVPTPSPSKGACVTLSAAIACNPVTNEPCNTAAGAACDFGGMGYQCYPPPNTQELCQMCNANGGPFCKGGETCDDGICVKFCCDNTDCGAGMCDKSGMFPGGIGECLGGNGGTSSSSSSASSSAATTGAGGGSSSASTSAATTGAGGGSSSASTSAATTGAGGGSSSASTSAATTGAGSSSAATTGASTGTN